MVELKGRSNYPLELIRQKEAEVTRNLAAVKEEAATRIAAAEQKAKEMVRQAEAQGKREGEAIRQSTLDETEREAWSILTAALTQAEALGNVSQKQIDLAVTRAITIIISVSWPAQEGEA